MQFRVPAFSATVSGTSISRVSLDPSANVKLNLINISFCRSPGLQMRYSVGIDIPFFGDRSYVEGFIKP